MQGEVEGEDVSDPSMLQSVEAAIRDNKSVKRIMIDGPHMQWINVATAILKGAAQKTSLKELELVTPKDLPPPQEVVDDVRRANPRLRLVVRARGVSASHDIIWHHMTAQHWYTVPHVQWSVGVCVSQWGLVSNCCIGGGTPLHWQRGFSSLTRPVASVCGNHP